MSSSAGKSEERSMSDILASIRKIMAQDPPAAGAVAPTNAAAGSPRPEPRQPTLDMPRVLGRPTPPEPQAETKPAAEPAARQPSPGPAPAPAAPVAAPSSASHAPSRPVSPQPAPGPQAPSLQAEEPVSLDEFLAMAAPPKSSAPGARLKPPRDDDPVTIPLVRPSTSSPAAAASPAAPAAPAPPFGPSTPVAVAKPAGPAAPAPETDRGASTEPVLGPLPAAPTAKSLSSATVPASAASAPKTEPLPAKDPAPPQAAAAPAPARPASSLGDLGSVVPGRPDTTSRFPGDAPIIEPQRPASATTGAPVLGPARAVPGPLAPPAASVRSGPAPIAEIPGADALRKLIADVVPPSAHAPLPTPPRSSDDVATEIVVPRAPSPKPIDTAKTPAAADVMKAPDAPASAKAPVTEPTPAPASSSAASFAAPAAASASPAKPEAAKPAPAPAILMPAPVVESTPTPAVKPAEASPLPAGRTMDETVIELLRPLLREWLDTNMPRLIEPALKAEMEALRAKLDEKPKS